MPRPAKSDKSTATKPANNSLVDLTKDLWQAAVTLRGSIEPSDYKRYVLPIIFLRFLALRFEKRRAELERLISAPSSDYHNDPAALEDPDEYRNEVLASATGTTVKHTSPGRIAAFKVVIDNGRPGNAFEARVRPLHLLMNRFLAEIESLSRTRGTLLLKLLSGEIRLKQAEQIVEKAL